MVVVLLDDNEIGLPPVPLLLGHIGFEGVLTCEFGVGGFVVEDDVVILGSLVGTEMGGYPGFLLAFKFR